VKDRSRDPEIYTLSDSALQEYEKCFLVRHLSEGLCACGTVEDITNAKNGLKAIPQTSQQYMEPEASLS
jgi:hypothetical protein